MEKNNSRAAGNLQSFLLYGSIFLLCLRFFGDYTPAMHAAVRLVYYVTVSGMITLIGYQTCLLCREKAPKRHYVRLAGGYAGLFLAAGMCRRCLDSGDAVIDSLLKLVTLNHIPKYTEIYFSIAVLALASLLLAAVIRKLLRHKILSAAIGLLLIAVLWLPSGLFQYSWVGVWLGTEIYSCIPLLAFALYYFLGFYFAEGFQVQGKRAWLLPAAGMLFTAALLLWKRQAFVSAIDFPCRYWEVLFPAGIVMILFFVCLKYLHSVRLPWLTGDAFPRTALMILLLFILKVYGGYSDLRAILRPLIFLAVWLTASLLWFLLVQVARWLRQGLFEEGRMKVWQYLVIYTIGFALISVLVFLPFIEKHISLIWDPDGIVQYYPKAVYFARTVRDALQSLLSGSFSLKTYDFTIGMGNRVQFSFDPVYWLYALFSAENMDTGFTVITVFRFWLAGLASSAMLIYFKKKMKPTLLCSYIYIFSLYGLYAIGRHPQFATGMTFLPLLVIAVDQILREKKWHLGTILVALSLLSNYYFLYMNTIALVVLFLVRFFCMDREQRTLSEFLGYLRTFAGAYILGAAMGCMTLFTTFSSYVGSSRSETSTIATGTLFTYEPSWLTSVYIYFLTTGRNAGYWLRFGLAPVVYLCLVLLFIRKGRRELKVLTTICFAAALIPAVGYAMGGFANITNRWVYIFILLLCLITAEMLPAVTTLTRREVRILSVSVVPYLLIALMYREYSNVYTTKALALLLATLLIFILSAEFVGVLRGRQIETALGLIVVLSLFVGGDTFFGTKGTSVVTEYVESGTAYETASAADIQALTSLEDDSFYRVSESYPQAEQVSAAMLLGLNGISYASSTMNGNMQEFNSTLGNVCASLITQKSYNNRTFLNALACVKYYSNEASAAETDMLPYGYVLLKSTEVDGTEYNIYENQYSLPLGYTYSQTISNTDFEKYSALEKQEIMMSTAVIGDDAQTEHISAVSSAETSVAKLENVSIKCKNVVMDDSCIYAEEGGTITFTFEGVENAETYLVLDGYCEPADDSLHSMSIRVKDACGTYTVALRTPDFTYALAKDAEVINCGYSEDGLTKITLTFKDAGTIYYDELGIYCQPMDEYPSQIAALTEDVLEDVKMQDNGVTGTISLTESKLLALSIPYQSGWTAYVDGEETELLKVNIMYMGLELEPGEHSIVLIYEVPGLKIGLVITALSVALFIILVLYGRRKRKS
ncbi:MAG: YfhO family protein [Lachnospiraceae bacterium]|nr:YfhO family protein [Lachnospiraceae bacterium]